MEPVKVEVENPAGGDDSSMGASVDGGQDWDTGAVRVKYDDNGVAKFSFRRLLMFAGPGMLVAIGYVDPGNLESDLQTGTLAGFSLGWLILLATLVGFTVQLIASRVGLVTGKDLAQNIRGAYPAAPRNVLWLMTEIAIIGSDIQEIIGSAIAINLISAGAIPLWAGVVITGFDTFILLFLVHLGVRKLEALFVVLVGTMAVSFGYMIDEASPPAGDVVKGLFVPSIDTSQISLAAGIIGCLVMPHNLFLHSALVQTRKIDVTRPGARREAVLYNAIESFCCVLITVFINICVMSVFATGFYHLPDAEKEHIGLSTAGQYLGDTFGPGIKYIWALGLLAAGQSSTMTGTYTGQFVMTGFLNLRVAKWKRAIVTRSIALVPTIIVAVIYAGNNKLDKLNQGLNVLQAVQLPFALLPALYIATRRHDLMGDFLVKSAFRLLAYAIAVLLLVVNLSVLATEIISLVDVSVGAAVPTIAVAVAYISFLTYLVIGPRLVHTGLSAMPCAFTRGLNRWLGDDGDTVFGVKDTLDGPSEGRVSVDQLACKADSGKYDAEITDEVRVGA